MLHLGCAQSVHQPVERSTSALMQALLRSPGGAAPFKPMLCTEPCLMA